MRSASTIAKTIKNGKRHASVHVVLHFWQSSEEAQNPAIVGFSVSKKVGNSVVRHLVTRRLRHIMAQRLDRLAPGAHLVIRALPSSATADFEQLRDSVDVALTKAGVS